MKTGKLFLACVALAAALTGCEIINPAEPVPSYIAVDHFDLAAAPLLGGNSQKITDVYVTIDNKYQGAYGLPAKFPVLSTGSHSVLLSAGIVVNGITNARGIYPFYTNYSQTVTLEPGKSVTLQPAIAYKDGIECKVCEGFEQTGLSINSTTQSDTALLRISDASQVYEGTACGAFFLDNNHTKFDLAALARFELPKLNKAIFMELNYRCDHEFTVGIIANISSGEERYALVTVNPKSEWNKIYIDLTSGVQIYGDATDYNFFITASKSSTQATAYFYFDNLKVLHN